MLITLLYVIVVFYPSPHCLIHVLMILQETQSNFVLKSYTQKMQVCASFVMVLFTNVRTPYHRTSLSSEIQPFHLHNHQDSRHKLEVEQMDAIPGEC